LRIKLVGWPPNRDAIGAWIELKTGGIVQRHQVMPTRKYLAQVELPVTFGLGKTDRVEPRVKKRPPKSFPFMIKPRQELRQQLVQQKLRD
jgi:hypothetical protein